MALSIKLIAPDSTRPALHVGIGDDSVRDQVVKRSDRLFTYLYEDTDISTKAAE